MLNSKDILLQILTEAPVGKTRLVKLLYLVEVEYYRATSERLTDLMWLFHYYGPYAFELEEILAQPEFAREQIKTQGEKDVTLFRVAEARIPYGWKLDARISLLVKKIVGEWRGKSLEELLDYVYFETEPMQAVQNRGDRLDFTVIKNEPEQIVVPLKASRETERRISELRKRIAPTLKRLGEQRTAAELAAGKEYQEAMKAWDEEMNKEFDPEAIKRISLTITRPTDDTGKQGN
jgi:hypothetical protein